MGTAGTGLQRFVTTCIVQGRLVQSSQRLKQFSEWIFVSSINIGNKDKDPPRWLDSGLFSPIHRVCAVKICSKIGI